MLASRITSVSETGPEHDLLDPVVAGQREHAPGAEPGRHHDLADRQIGHAGAVASIDHTSPSALTERTALAPPPIGTTSGW